MLHKKYTSYKIVLLFNIHVKNYKNKIILLNSPKVSRIPIVAFLSMKTVLTFKNC